MSTLSKRIWQFIRGEDGATLVEYGLLIGILSVVALATIIVVGRFVNGAFNEVGRQVPSAGDKTGPGNVRTI